MKYKIKGLDIEITEEQLNELNKQRENKGEKYFFPKDGEAYYAVDWRRVRGTVKNIPYDDEIIDRGVFRTEELAKKEDEKRKALVRMSKWSQDNGLFFEPDWSDENQKKYSPYYDHKNKKWSTSPVYYYQVNFLLPHFKNFDDCQKFIDNNLSDLNLFI